MAERTTLGDVLRLADGSIKTGPFGTALKAAEYVTDGTPVISVGEIGYGDIQLSGKTPRVGEDVVARMPEYLLEAGDIVFGRKGAVDRSAWVKPEESGYFLGSDGIRVRFTGGKVDAQFMAYQLQTPVVRDWLLQHAAGTTMASLNQSILEAIPVVVPQLPMQQSIAEVLGALDDKIAANIVLTQKVDDYLAASFEQALHVPHELVPLSEVADVNAKTVKPDPCGSLRYVDIAAVAVGRVAYPGASSWEEAPGRARRGIRPGDTLWSTVRPGRRSHALVLVDDDRLVGSTGLAVLSPREVGFAYLYEAARRLEFTDYLVNVAEGSAYPAVKAARFKSAPIPLLPDIERTGFDRVAEPLRRHSACLDEENRCLAEMRDALLPALMSGRLRVKDAEKVVGEVV